ncbi:AP2 domain-containing protein [Aerococcaceae bacterium zg-B36]|uniref:AP2 domain-containing protein n=1 Tax=Aerococcaceae bacterium zg-252 TaxID=2796928 RepID=UPI001BD819A0|nr:AP2 domain-containing protein [Aerococcaceae bacterium zg-B36]
MRKKDLTNKRFGRLTVVEDDGTRTNGGKIKWLCQCDCGNMCYVESNQLKSGKTRSCGCLLKEIKSKGYLDLSNQENDNFKVISRAYSKKQRVHWNCLCKHCGNEVILNSRQFKLYSSCGCKHWADKEYMKSISDPDSLRTTKPTAKSTTGVRGVYYQKSRKRYVASINANKKRIFLGSSVHFEEAVRLRREAEKLYGYKDKK